MTARSLIYWRRDPRYLTSVTMMLFLPLSLLLVPLTGGGNGWTLAMAPAAGFFSGWSMHNDIAYDGTAFWGHIAIGVSGRANRIAGLVPVAMLSDVLLTGYITFSWRARHLGPERPLWAAWLCLGMAIFLGSTVLVVRLRWGARVYERRTLELLVDLTRLR